MGPVKSKGKEKAAAAPEYISSSESSDSQPSGSEDEDLATSLHARTKAAAIMAGIAVPPGCRRDRFKKRYAQYSAEKTLGKSLPHYIYWLSVVSLFIANCRNYLGQLVVPALQALPSSHHRQGS